MIVLLVLIVVVIVVLRGSEAEVALEVPNGPKLSIKPRSEMQIASARAQELDPATYFVDSARGFAFRKPTGAPWKSTTASGLEAALQAKGLDDVDLGAPSTEVERMLYAVEWQRLSTGPTFTLGFAEDTTADVLGETVSLGELSNLLGSDIDFVNALEISAYDKALLEDTPLSLPTFYSALVTSLGVSLDKLVADTGDGTILGSASFRIKRARLDGRRSDVNIDRAFLFTESATRFFVVEAAYSPQTDEPLERWNAALEAVESFQVIDD